MRKRDIQGTRASKRFPSNSTLQSGGGRGGQSLCQISPAADPSHVALLNIAYKGGWGRGRVVTSSLHLWGMTGGMPMDIYEFCMFNISVFCHLGTCVVLASVGVLAFRNFIILSMSYFLKVTIFVFCAILLLWYFSIV